VTTSQLPSADAAWLHMDTRLNPMVVNAVIWFDEPIDLARARDVVQQRLVDEFPRFRQRVAEPFGRPPRFEDDLEFDIDQHLHRIALPAPGDHRALEELVSDLITPPLDPTRPLWHTYLIEGFGEGCALLFRERFHVQRHLRQILFEAVDVLGGDVDPLQAQLFKFGQGL